MVRFRLAALALLAFAAAALAGGGADAECKITGIAALKVTMDGTRAMAPTKINGAEARFIVDSGAFFSIISPAAAAQYGLKVTHGTSRLSISGVTGESEVQKAEVKTFTLAGVPLPNVSFLVGGSDVGSGAAGLLGENVLGIADVDYDLGDGVIRLMRPEGCGFQPLAYWAGTAPISTMDIETGELQGFDPPRGTAYVNGVKILVVFDTGAGVSILTLDAAKRAKIDIHGPGVVDGGLIGGVGRETAKSWIAPLASFKIGDEEIRNSKIRISAAELPGIDMLVGPDFFLAHHIYVANSQHKLYFTYNGGPVFNLQTPATATAASAEANAPKDADGLARRGAAFAARGEYTAAIADFDRAVALSPKDASYFYERGQAHVGDKQPKLARADFDRALTLAPDDTPALIARAMLRVEAKDMAGAIADLDAADKAAPKQGEERLEMATLYMRADTFSAAAAQFTVWMASHPQDLRLPIALDGRCRARALLNQQLDQAMTDCETALRLAPKTAQILDSRGLVRLRQGDAAGAIADYDAALALKPNTATSLWGRGLAELKKGLAAQGKADLAAAAAIDPALPDRAKKDGLAP